MTGRPATVAVTLPGGLVLASLLFMAGCAPTPEVPPPPSPVPPPAARPAPEACEGCHNTGAWDPDGRGRAARAPNVMGDGTDASSGRGAYGDGTWGYNVNGHGTRAIGNPSRPVVCGDCHLLREHHEDGALNTLDWPGTDNLQRPNTSHLVEGFLAPSGTPLDYQVTFDDFCTTACHPPGIEMRHSDYVDAGGRGAGAPVPDKVMLFGEHKSNPDPKKVRSGETLWGAGPYGAPYGECEKYSPDAVPEGCAPGDPSASYWFPWTIADLTSAVPQRPPSHGVCVSCHDPHGTPTIDESGGSNHMVRYNWRRPPRTDAPFFCNSQCHRP